MARISFWWMIHPQWIHKINCLDHQTMWPTEDKLQCISGPYNQWSLVINVNEERESTGLGTWKMTFLHNPIWTCGPKISASEISKSSLVSKRFELRFQREPHVMWVSRCWMQSGSQLKKFDCWKDRGIQHFIRYVKGLTTNGVLGAPRTLARDISFYLAP